MRYKRMNEMLQEEIEQLLLILLPYAMLLDYEKQEDYIDVHFRIIGQNKIYTMALLPDYPQDIPENISISGDSLWEYEQFMIAKAYSEYWLNNKFVNGL